LGQLEDKMAPQRWIWGMTAAAAAVLLLPAFSQTSTGSAPTTGTTGTRPSPTGNTGSIPNQNSNVLNQPAMARPLRVSGRVIIDDGSPLDFPATIERVCNGNPHVEGYTDSQGNFSLILGQHPDVIGDASETSNGSNRQPLPPGISGGNTQGIPGTNGSSQNLSGDFRVANCDLRANLSGYLSDTINLAGRTSMDTPDIGNIMLHRMGGGSTATTVTATTLKAPKAARKALDHGLELAKKNKPEEAIVSLEEAVRLYPEFAYAWCELGKLQFANDHEPDAHESFEAAVKAEPRWPEPYLHLAVMGVKAHDWKEVAGDTGKVLHLNTFQYPQAYFLHGAASFNLRNFDVAEEDALSAEKLDVQHTYPQIEKLLGMIYTERHRYTDAADKLRSYLLLSPEAQDAAEARKLLANAEIMAAQSAQAERKKAQQ
jgi:tetratricopeptide (TPR) repeat protein